jgi:anti-sigma factor RsiW
VSLVLPKHLRCKEVVELVTAYVDGALDVEDRGRFEEHLVSCGACVTYVDQMRQTVEIAGELAEEGIDPGPHSALLDAFRSFRLPGDEGR